MSNLSPYRPRSPKLSPLYQLAEDYNEQLELSYKLKYQSYYGFYRTIVRDVLFRFLDCGNLRNGFRTARCDNCGVNHILPYSCKKSFCPSCSQRHSLEFAENMVNHIISGIPVRSITLTIPKRIRIFFNYDHSLFQKLSHSAYETFFELYREILENKNMIPGMVCSIHTYGKLVNLHPHVHALVSEGAYERDGSFHHISYMPSRSQLEELFTLNVLRMLVKEEKISGNVADNILNWKHSGFNVYVGASIHPEDKEIRERAAAYLIHPAISLEKMRYLPEEGRVVYGDRRASKSFNALDFLAMAVSHIPDKNERRIAYYGWWSNKTRGMRKKTESAGNIIINLEHSICPMMLKKKWAYFIRKVWGADPEKCLKCGGKMIITGYEEDPVRVKNILISLNLWEMPANTRPPPFCFFEEPALIEYTEIVSENTFRDIDPGWDAYLKSEPFYEEKFITVD